MRIEDLLLNKKTVAQAKAFLSKPSHALLITGAPGSGKASLAFCLAAELLKIDKGHELSDYPYFTHLSRPQDKQDIPIDSVRNLSRILKLKAPGLADIKRVILIENAHDLNEESSNALLKMLEEPARDCVFILTARSPQNLLPTISSRAQLLQVHPISPVQAQSFWKDQYPSKKIDSAWQLSQGSVGLMGALLRDQNDHPLKLAIEQAKKFLRQNKYERLLEADALTRDKHKLRFMLEALIRVLSALHHSAVERGSLSQQVKLIASRKLVNGLTDKLDANASPKLIALELALNLI